jgi:signal transduction histidine kinase
MHDVLAHSLSGLALHLEGARLLAAEDPADPRLGGVIERAHDLAKTGVQEARWAIGMLRGDELPGPDRLAALVTEFARDGGIGGSFSVTGRQRPLSPGVRLALFRITQEALTNVRKHAHAERVEVGLDYRPQEVVLAIEDFCPADAAGGASAAFEAGGEAGAADAAAPGGAAGGPTVDAVGYGLTGMAERADLLGATLSAARTDAGFLVTMRVPA